MAVGPDRPSFDPELEAWDMRQRVAEQMGVMQDVGKSALICDVCDYIDWDGRTEDGDPCPECEERTDD